MVKIRLPLRFAACAALCLCTLAKAHAQFTYAFFPNDITVNYAVTPTDFAIVGYAGGSFVNFLAPSSPTVNVVSGGSIKTELDVFNSSTVNISGGSVGKIGGFNLNALDSSTINVSGGVVINVEAVDNSTVTFSGGMVNALSALVNAKLFVTGGTILYDLTAIGHSVTNISGGSFGSGSAVLADSIVNFSGGSFGGGISASDNSTTNVSGGSFGSRLFANDNSTIKVSGGTFQQSDNINFFDFTTGGFTIIGTNLIAISVGADPLYGGTNYDLSGTLADGTDLSGYILNVHPGSAFKLQNASTVPEPGDLALLFGFCLTGIGVLIRNKKLNFTRVDSMGSAFSHKH